MSCLVGVLPMLSVAEESVSSTTMTPHPVVPDVPVVAQVAVPTAVAADTGPHFDIFEFEIEGNTVLAPELVVRTVEPFLGPDRQMAQVEAARAALEKAYQDAGYLTVFVDVPEQRVNAGVVQLKVLEGHVSRLIVSGSRYFSQGFIRQRVPELADGKVPNFNVVQAQLAEVNRTEDRRVQPILKPGREPGTVDTELKVIDRFPLSASVEMHNHRSQYTREWRWQFNASYNNLFQRDHTLSMTAIVAPQNPQQSRVFTASYFIPELLGNGWLGYWVWSDSNLDVLGGANILGNGNTWGLRRIINLPGLKTYGHNLSIGLDYKNMREKTLFGQDGFATPLRYMPFNLAYNGTWQNSETALTTFGVTGVLNLRPIFKRKVTCNGIPGVDQFECKRQDADGGFGLVKLDIKHTHAVTNNWTAQWRLAGQAATQQLVGAEQYAIGGGDSVRGYLEAEAVGDHAYWGSVELRSPNWAHARESWKAWLNELTVYGFLDAGRVVTIEPGVGQDKSKRLVGTGLGLKLRAFSNVSTTLDWAWPLVDGADRATKAHRSRLHVRLNAEF